MGKMRDDYGSQRWILEHTQKNTGALDHVVAQVTGGVVIRWLAPPPAGYDGLEWKGLDFLPEDHPARRAWKLFWPQSGNVHNWDAVGELEKDGQREWLLVEAKAHLDEIKSSCAASSPESRAKIVAAIDATKLAMRVDPRRDWLQTYYQYANRLAALHFLNANGVPARLLMVYFLGDTNPHAPCPQTEEEWRGELHIMHNRLGLTGKSLLESRVHELFLPVRVTTRA